VTNPASPRHPFELLLEQLTGCMSRRGAPIRHGFGTQEDASHTDADRIVWIPPAAGGLGVGPIPYQLPNAENPWRQIARFDVSIYGGSPFAVFQRHADLVAWIDLLVGPPQGAPPLADGTNPHRPGYQIGDARVGPRGGDAGSTAWGAVVVVTLYAPISRRVFPLAPVQEVSVQVATSAPDGSDLEVAVP
jgi:hypothetical protein